ncbi:IS200/IS605 family transposase [Cytophaga hutchinsonii]|uniref:Transposase n=1 Tax=Cytophaga hutchinsonii (strain ATCC 33406 / DSM 1761 / CIP 103989 / NBRC 15051 / NCIMB 9469 / D465) TaxID=269798 RepID=A0A6N4SQQ9_CYTH3|nr:IS200/IS605 family transposase [Cytophaga hutchinsonii]ABG58712.1 transposase [Cytophaga hutchinsonii ATCC 33406]SFX60161.1 REP element-mobilizing transposase RayT [Cytophaga hutchinsonii ATCC 33406]
MGQSLSQMYIHLIFGTKNRYPFIIGSVETELHKYIAEILKSYESPAIKINSVPDHMHILFRLSKNYTLVKIIEEIKKHSSKWMKSKGIDGFTWQIGYGAFSVSSSKIDTVSNYIMNQKEHHKIISFKDEVEGFMKKYHLCEYDPEYFWV